jgi:hypothetical protein
VTTPIPPVRPGTVAQPDQGLIDRVRELERVVDELQRKDMRNATVGQGGTFRGLYDNGNAAFSFGRNKDDGIRKSTLYWPSTGKEAFQIGPGNQNINPPELEQMRFRDQANNILFGTDGVAGYGFVEPLLAYPQYAIPGLNYVAGVAQQATECQNFFYNAAIWSTIRVRAFTGTITSVSVQLRLRHSNADIAPVVSSITSGVAANSAVRKAVAVPEEYISAQFTFCDWWITANGNGTVEVWPIMSRGISRTFYDISAGDQ